MPAGIVILRINIRAFFILCGLGGKCVCHGVAGGNSPHNLAKTDLMRQNNVKFEAIEEVVINFNELRFILDRAEPLVK